MHNSEVNKSHIAEPAQLLVRWLVIPHRHIDPEASEIFLTQKCDSDRAEHRDGPI